MALAVNGILGAKAGNDVLVGDGGAYILLPRRAALLLVAVMPTTLLTGCERSKTASHLIPKLGVH